MLVFGVDKDLRVITVGGNVLVRYPDDWIQPYVGVGAGLYFAKLEGGGVTRTDYGVPGFNAQAGVRVFVTDTIAIFGEWKYNHATFAFKNFVNSINKSTEDTTTGGIEGVFAPHIGVVGVSVHFN